MGELGEQEKDTTSFSTTKNMEDKPRGNTYPESTLEKHPRRQSPKQKLPTRNSNGTPATNAIMNIQLHLETIENNNVRITPDAQNPHEQIAALTKRRRKPISLK